MKKLLFLVFAFACMMPFFAAAQSAPVMVFETLEIDYGTIQKGADGNRIFKFVNTGNGDLIIKSAKSPCGCVRPTYDDKIYKPGKIGEIKVTYDTMRVGEFKKTVMVMSNCEPDMIVLTIKGVVVDSSPNNDAPAAPKN